MTERKDAVTMKGESLTLMGEELKVGAKAPEFKVLDKTRREVVFSGAEGKIRLIASVPSLDTPVCDLQIKRFNDEAAALSKDIAITFISMDLPFAQKRFCGEFNIKKVKAFSDHKYADFGVKYGVLIKELRLLARAIFVVDRSDTLRYVEYVKDITSHPDYDAALGAVKSVL
jgi:thioredoxin-dependent peroxiredoxin